MNNFNIMFAFGSRLNETARCGDSFEPVSAARQMELYEKLQAAFTGTELEEGLRRNWFDEFKPSYCTNAFNCGERFYLLQGDGEVYSCVRGQGIEAFRYGNLLREPVDTVLDNGARKISAIHQAHGFDSDCRSCGHLSLCHTGCPVVKHQQGSAKSYTCGVQKLIYRDNPASYPAAPDKAAQQEQVREYAAGMHPGLLLTGELPAPPAPPAFRVPNDLAEAKNTLDALVAADPLLQALYDPAAFILEFADGELLALDSQLIKPRRRIFTLAEGEPLTLHVRRDILLAACAEPVRNTVYLQVLRDTPVVYGDEQRTKQAHLYTYQCYADCLDPSARFGETHASLGLAPLLAMHRHLYQRGVANNLFVTTQYLRDYHYQKQRNNAFYHLQAVNLPFQNLEFHYLAAEEPVS